MNMPLLTELIGILGTRAIKITLLRSLNHAAFLVRLAAGDERCVAAEVFLDFTSVSGFTNSSKLGQMVARPQWIQSGFWA